MQSKTSFFSIAMYRKNLSRFYLLALLYTVAQCLMLPLLLSISLGVNQMGSYQSYNTLMIDAIRTIFDTTQFSLFVAFFGACVSAMAVFSYLYSSSSANMTASLPIKREAVFTSAIAAIYTVVIFANLVAGLLAVLVALPHGLALGTYIMQWILIQIAQFTICFGIACVAAVITGNIVAMPMIYAVMHFAAVAFGSCFSFLMSTLCYGVSYSMPNSVMRLSPVAMLMSSSSYAWRDYNISYDMRSYTDIYLLQTNQLAIYFIAGLVLIALAFFIHRARRMETAGDIVSVKILRPIFKILITVAAGIIVAPMFCAALFYDYYSDMVYVVGTLVFSFVGYILADMLVEKRSKIVAKRVLPVAAVSAFVMAGFVFAIDADVVGAETKIPELAEIASVEVYGAGNSITLISDAEIAQAIAIHNQLISEKEYNDNGNNIRYTYVYLNYTLGDGTIFRRDYTIRGETEDELIASSQLIAELMNSPDNVLLRKNYQDILNADGIYYAQVETLFDESDPELGHTSINLSDSEANELLYDCILPDMLDGNIGLVQVGGAQYDFEFYDNCITIELYGASLAPEYGDSYYLSTHPTTKSWRTNAWLEEKGVALELMQ